MIRCLFSNPVRFFLLLCVAFSSGCKTLPSAQRWEWFEYGTPDVIVQATILNVDRTREPEDGGTIVYFMVDKSQRGSLTENTRSSFAISYQALAVPSSTYVVPYFEKNQRWLLCLHTAPAGTLYVKYIFYSFRIDELISLVKDKYPNWKGPVYVKRTGENSFTLNFVDPDAPKAPPSVFIENGRITGIGRM